VEEEKRVRDWLAKVVNRVDSDEEDQGTEIKIKDKDENNDGDKDEHENKDEEIEQEEEDQVVKEEDSELSDVRSDQFEDRDMTYSVIEVLDSEVMPEVMPEVMSRVASGRATRSRRVQG
jgi:hypothetical protein